MRMPNDPEASPPVVLAGAGFSVPFGIPAMREFYLEFAELVRKRYPTLAPTLDGLRPRIGSDGDLEVLLTHLNRGAESAEAIPDSAKNDQLERWASDCTDLRTSLQSFIIERCEQFDRAKVHRLVTPLLRLLVEARCPLFTTNYDRLPEVGAEPLAIVPSDGFETTPGLLLAKWTKTLAEPFRLIKLHGSVTWYYDDARQEYFRLDRGYPMPAPGFHLSRDGVDLRPLMIIPTSEKNALTAPYTFMSREYTLRLDRSRLVIVIGSSLRDEYLANAISDNSEHLVAVIIGLGSEQAARRLHDVDCFTVEAPTELFLEVGLHALERLLSAGTADLQTIHDHAETFVAEVDNAVAMARALSLKQRNALSVMERGASSPQEIRAIDDLRACREEPHVRSTLIRATTSGDPSVRAAATSCLAHVSALDAVTALRNAAEHDPSSAVRLEAALALRATSLQQIAEADAAWKSLLLDGPDRDALRDLTGDSAS